MLCGAESYRANFYIPEPAIQTYPQTPTCVVREAALQVGKYLTDNIYTDVTTSTAGKTELNLNIDVTSDITVKGGADNEGETSLGIFFERDY